MSTLLLGVDGGATKTVALVAEPSGRVIGAGRSGSSDIHNEQPQVAIDHVIDSVTQALGAADASSDDLAAAVFGLCGADWPEDDELYAGALRDAFGAPAPVVVNDAFNTLRAGTDDGVGVALVLGTGAAVAARGPDGLSWFSGERMESAGAMELGRQAFDAVVRGEYGGGPRPSFEAGVLASGGAASVEEMLHDLTRVSGPGRRSLGRLAPALLDASHAGDPQARQIVEEQGTMLADYVRAAAARVGLSADSSTLVLSGGVLRHHASDMRDAVTARLPEFVAVTPVLEPVHGALLMAADAATTELDPDLLASSGPGQRFFATGS